MAAVGEVEEPPNAPPDGLPKADVVLLCPNAPKPLDVDPPNAVAGLMKAEVPLDEPKAGAGVWVGFGTGAGVLGGESSSSPGTAPAFPPCNTGEPGGESSRPGTAVDFDDSPNIDPRPPIPKSSACGFGDDAGTPSGLPEPKPAKGDGDCDGLAD